jgi:hypothetical protein
MQAAAQLGLAVFHFAKDDVLERAAHARKTTTRDLEHRLKSFGTTYGRPWRKEQIVACAGAILAHISAVPSLVERS